MKIGVISDIHDNVHNLVLALNELINNHKVGQIIFLGDFVGAAISRILKSAPVPVFAIWGNNDGDHYIITKISMSEGSNLTMSFEVFDTVEFDNRKIFLSHYPMLAMPMAKSGDFDAVFYGHNHLKHMEKVGDCLVLNPGEIAAYKTGIASYAVYDTDTNSAEIFELESGISTNTDVSKKEFEKIKFAWN